MTPPRRCGQLKNSLALPPTAPVLRPRLLSVLETTAPSTPCSCKGETKALSGVSVSGAFARRARLRAPRAPGRAVARAAAADQDRSAAPAAVPALARAVDLAPCTGRAQPLAQQGQGAGAPRFERACFEYASFLVWCNHTEKESLLNSIAEQNSCIEPERNQANTRGC